MTKSQTPLIERERSTQQYCNTALGLRTKHPTFGGGVEQAPTWQRSHTKRINHAEVTDRTHHMVRTLPRPAPGKILTHGGRGQRQCSERGWQLLRTTKTAQKKKLTNQRSRLTLTEISLPFAITRLKLTESQHRTVVPTPHPLLVHDPDFVRSAVL